jgi:hypothetical protein
MGAAITGCSSHGFSILVVFGFCGLRGKRRRAISKTLRAVREQEAFLHSGLLRLASGLFGQQVALAEGR